MALPFLSPERDGKVTRIELNAKKGGCVSSHEVEIPFFPLLPINIEICHLRVVVVEVEV